MIFSTTNMAFIILFAFFGKMALSNPLEKYQWHLKNSGQPIKVDISQKNRKSRFGDYDINNIKGQQNQNNQKEIIIALIDSGVDENHPDLKGKLVQGYNFLDESENTYDDIGHGTHTAGIIVAKDNNIGVKGVAPHGVKVMPLKVLNAFVKEEFYRYPADGRRSVFMAEYFEKAIAYAIEKDVDVINMSMGWPYYLINDKLINVLKRAIDNEIAVVVATGNDGKEIGSFPCRFEGVICVGAVSNDGEKFSGSNYGQSIDLFAPGHEIYSTLSRFKVSDIPGDHPLYRQYYTNRIPDVKSTVLRKYGYEIMDGTSMAAPIVSAAIGLIKREHGDISLNEIKARLYSQALPQPHSSFGLLNIKQAVELKKEDIKFVAPSFKGINEININSDKTFQFEFPITNYGLTKTKTTVAVESLSSGVTISNPNMEFEQNGDEKTIVTIHGKVDSLNIDRATEFRIKLSSNDENRYWDIKAVLTRNLGLKDLPSYNISNDVIFSKSPYFSSVGLLPIVDEFSRLDYPSYIVISRGKLPSNILLKTLSFKDAQYKVTEIAKPEKNAEFRNIVVDDFNLDGSPDYAIFYRNMKSGTYNLFFLDHNFKNLYPVQKNVWSFEGLQKPLWPISDEIKKEYVKYKWIKKRVEGLGTIKVPLLQAKSQFDPRELSIEDEGINYVKKHLVVLSPDANFKIKMEILDNYEFHGQLRSKMSEFVETSSNREIKYHNHFKVPKDGGVFNEVFSIGEESKKDYFHIKLDSSRNFSLSPLDIDGFELEYNTPYKVASLNELVETEGHTYSYMRRDSATTGRILDLEENKSTVLKSKSFLDPFIGKTYGVFKRDDGLMAYFGSLFSLNFHRSDLDIEVKPLIRESAMGEKMFVAVQRPVKVKMEQSFVPGLIIDHTKIVGPYLYVNIFKNNKMVTPISHSFTIPINCKALAPSVSIELGHTILPVFCQENNENRLYFIKL